MMTEGITITRCQANDLQDLTHIARKTFIETFAHLNDPKHFDPYIDKAFTPAQIESELNNVDSRFFFIRLHNQLAGYLKLNFNNAQTDIKDPDCMEIERIYLLAPFHGKGLGKALFAHSLGIARNLRLRYVWLGVWEKNIKAIDFYESQGFYKFDKHPFKLGDDLQSDYLMRLDLRS